jgi:hypothetical protein
MANSPTDEKKRRMIEEAILSLAAQGFLYDTGERRWSERTQSYQIVWALTAEGRVAMTDRDSWARGGNPP